MSGLHKMLLFDPLLSQEAISSSGNRVLFRKPATRPAVTLSRLPNSPSLGPSIMGASPRGLATRPASHSSQSTVRRCLSDRSGLSGVYAAPSYSPTVYQASRRSSQVLHQDSSPMTTPLPSSALLSLFPAHPIFTGRTISK